jgi:hypothetical protein
MVARMSLVLSARCCSPAPSFCSRYVCRPAGAQGVRVCVRVCVCVRVRVCVCVSVCACAWALEFRHERQRGALLACAAPAHALHAAAPYTLRPPPSPARAHLYLALALGAKRGLVDGQQHELIVVGQHHAVEAAVQRAHVLRHKLGKLVEACAPRVQRGKVPRRAACLSRPWRHRRRRAQPPTQPRARP